METTKDEFGQPLNEFRYMGEVKVNPNAIEWNYCPVYGCTNRNCLALKSDMCFTHTKGKRWWKLIKIWWNNRFK